MKQDDKTLIALGFFALLAVIVYLVYSFKIEELKTNSKPQQNQMAQLKQALTPQKQQEPVLTEEIRPTTAHQINHHLNEANKWYEIKIPRDVMGWYLRPRQFVNLYYSFSPAHQNYMTINAGAGISGDVAPNKDINAIYIMTEDPGTIIEMEMWMK